MGVGGKMGRERGKNCKSIRFVELLKGILAKVLPMVYTCSWVVWVGLYVGDWTEMGWTIDGNGGIVLILDHGYGLLVSRMNERWDNDVLDVMWG